MAKKMIPIINVLTEKTTPVDADMYIIEDSADSNAKKKVLHSKIKQLLQKSGTILTTATAGDSIEASDHGTASTDEVVNVCYGTGAEPAANTTTEGALFIKYTA